MNQAKRIQTKTRKLRSNIRKQGTLPFLRWISRSFAMIHDWSKREIFTYANQCLQNWDQPNCIPFSMKIIQYCIPFSFDTKGSLEWNLCNYSWQFATKAKVDPDVCKTISRTEASWVCLRMFSRVILVVEKWDIVCIGSWILAYICNLTAAKHIKNDWNPLYLAQCKQTLLKKEWVSFITMWLCNFI